MPTFIPPKRSSHGLDRLVASFGDTTLAFSSSIARLVTASSVSNSAIRRRAESNSPLFRRSGTEFETAVDVVLTPAVVGRLIRQPKIR